jgi:folate-dependent phosphoribosylglycinamide formyltransferase PurN
MENKKIVMLAGEGASTNIIYHAINSIYPICSVIIEEKEDTRNFVKRRIKKLGIMTVIGQIFFQFFIMRMLSIFSIKRINAIIKENQLKASRIPANKIKRVTSINDESVKEILQQINPEVVIVNGTRIISKKILGSVNCAFINTHAGITPMYRGVHGAYWALVNNDKTNCGVTIHQVDTGIDTGNILYQSKIDIIKQDNFVTYPYLQIAQGILILQKAVGDALKGKLNAIVKTGTSNLWYHPTIWQYLYYRLFKNVK